MKQLLKRLMSDSIAFAFVTIGNKFVAFFLFPIFLRYLTVNEYADWGLTNTIMIVISYFAILGTDAALAFYYHDVKTDEERKGYFTASLIITGLIGLLFVVLFFFLSEPLAQVIYQTGSDHGGFCLLHLLP